MRFLDPRSFPHQPSFQNAAVAVRGHLWRSPGREDEVEGTENCQMLGSEHEKWASITIHKFNGKVFPQPPSLQTTTHHRASKQLQSDVAVRGGRSVVISWQREIREKNVSKDTQCRAWAFRIAKKKNSKVYHEHRSSPAHTPSSEYGPHTSAAVRKKPVKAFWQRGVKRRDSRR